MFVRVLEEMWKIFMIGLFLLAVAIADPWNQQNNPSLFGNYSFTFKTLPKEGMTASPPWSDTCELFGVVWSVFDFFENEISRFFCFSLLSMGFGLGGFNS